MEKTNYGSETKFTSSGFNMLVTNRTRMRTLEILIWEASLSAKPEQLNEWTIMNLQLQHVSSRIEKLLCHFSKYDALGADIVDSLFLTSIWVNLLCLAVLWILILGHMSCQVVTPGKKDSGSGFIIHERQFSGKIQWEIDGGSTYYGWKVIYHNFVLWVFFIFFFILSF